MNKFKVEEKRKESAAKYIAEIWWKNKMVKLAKKKKPRTRRN